MKKLNSLGLGNSGWVYLYIRSTILKVSKVFMFGINQRVNLQMLHHFIEREKMRILSSNQILTVAVLSNKHLTPFLNKIRAHPPPFTLLLLCLPSPVLY